MEIIQNKDNNDDYYIGTTIMIRDRNGLNSFYKVIKYIDEMFYIRKIKTETNLYKINHNEIKNKQSNVYEAKLLDEFENEKFKKIKKINIHKYPIIYCSIIQYEV